MKKLVAMTMVLGLWSLELSAQNNTQTGNKTQSSMQDTSRKRIQDTNRNRRMNERNRTNRIDTSVVSPVDTALNNINKP